MGLVLSRGFTFFKAVCCHSSNKLNTFSFRIDQCECLVLEEGLQEEADLHKHLRDCEKNPGHEQFISIQTFRLGHIPEPYRDNDMYQWIKSCAELTVRVDVQGTSPNRPKSYMMETNYGRIIYSYPSYNQRGLKNKRYGSGALSLTKYIEGFDVTDSVLVQPKPICNTCPCETCQHSDNPSRTWWRIYVLTGAHVVFDDVEASNTTCRLFYDEPSSPLVTLGKMETGFFNIVRDECQLCYVTCAPIGDKLFQLIEKRFRLWLIVKNKFQKPKEETFNFIVSHPHGCSKQITFGHWIQKSVFVMEDSEATDDMDYTSFNYTTATCPGSSGARVYTIARGINLHCGAIKNGANFSGIGPYEK